eukprot:3558757-Pleurochrysis_carterae.AAC.1
MPPRQYLRRHWQLPECSATHASHWRQFWLHRVLLFVVSFDSAVQTRRTGGTHYSTNGWGQRQ